MSVEQEVKMRDLLSARRQLEAARDLVYMYKNDGRTPEYVAWEHCKLAIDHIDAAIEHEKKSRPMWIPCSEARRGAEPERIESMDDEHLLNSLHRLAYMYHSSGKYEVLLRNLQQEYNRPHTAMYSDTPLNVAFPVVIDLAKEIKRRGLPLLINLGRCRFD